MNVNATKIGFIGIGEMGTPMAGGDVALFERARPLFEKLGKQIFHVGPLGAGHAVKALNNYVSAAGLLAACEAVVAGSRFGLKPETIVDILNASSGMNTWSTACVPHLALELLARVRMRDSDHAPHPFR